jgi:hypothetical protein
MALVKNVAVFNRLIARGVKLTAMQGGYGLTFCHVVAHNITCEDDLRVFVAACGNDAVHAVDILGKTPLHCTCTSPSSNDSAVRVLVEFGAELDRQDYDGKTALFDAAGWNSRTSSVELLLALGADVAVVRDNGETACHFAARCEHPSALSALVAAGGDLDQRDNYGETPRMIATRLEFSLPTADEIEAARHRIAKTRLDLVRERAFQICVGLQSFRLSALQLCEILMHSFGTLGSLILFHQWWGIATKVKHFRDHKQQSSATTTSHTSCSQIDQKPPELFPLDRRFDCMFDVDHSIINQ